MLPDRPAVAARSGQTKEALYMKVLFIGGTGFISSAVSRLAAEGHRAVPAQPRAAAPPTCPEPHVLHADIHRPDDVRAVLGGREFDVVVDWIAFTPDDVERDLALFRGRVGQYVFISSASAYQKPPATTSSPSPRRCTTPTGSTPATRSPARSA